MTTVVSTSAAPIKVVDGVAYNGASRAYLIAREQQQARQTTIRKASGKTERSTRTFEGITPDMAYSMATELYHDRFGNPQYRSITLADKAEMADYRKYLQVECGMSKSVARKVAQATYYAGTVAGNDNRPNGLQDKRIMKREKMRWKARTYHPRISLVDVYRGGELVAQSLPNTRTTWREVARYRLAVQVAMLYHWHLYLMLERQIAALYHVHRSIAAS